MSNVSKEIAIELVEDGKAGNGIVSVTRTYGISASGTTQSDTTSPSDISSWSAGSPTVTTAKPYIWVKEVTVYTDTPDTTKYYCVGKRGDNGVDAKDVEWVYIRTTTPNAPTILNDNTYTDSNGKTYTADSHLPRVDSTNRTDIEKENSGSSSKYYECTDDPKGVNDDWKYEWEIKRTKGNVGADGSTRAWNYYTGSMTLHNNYAESAFIIDIDNDNDQFGTDSDSKVLVEQVRTTKVTLYDGAAPQTLTGLTATLKYEDGTNVPTSVATKTTTVSTGVVSVTVKQNNTANTHTEIQAHIEATCEKGSRTIVFTLYKVMGGQPGLTPIIYNVAATNKVFSFQRTDANALTPSSRTSQINVARTEGNTTTILDTAQTGLTFSWGFDDDTTAQASSQSIGDTIEVTNTNAASHSSVWVELSTGDRETLSIVKDGAKGDEGDKGDKGDKGDDGRSVMLDSNNSSITYAFSQYGVAGSGRSYPSDITSWSPSVPTAQQGKYLWTRDITAYKYSDGTSAGSTTTYGVSYYATDGSSVEIDTSRTNVRYSTQKTASQPNDNTFTRTTPPELGQGDYLWCRSQTAYVGVSDVLKSYSVSRIGTDGDEGDKGADGYTTHFAYATSADGSQNFSTTNFNGATFIGTYRDQNAADSTTYTDYVWTKWRGDSGTSVEARYAPNDNPTSSEIHTTFQSGDMYMSTRESGGSWSDWQKIVGENGAETDFTFNISKNKTSTNASTAPANCYYSEWQDAPIAVTTTYPYLWAKVVQKDGDGTTQSTSYIRLTGEDGKSVLAQYSVDGSSNWHTTFATGDEWMRTSDNGGTSWSAAMKIVGEDGDSTNFEFGISQYQTANGAPSDISTWSDAPIATTSSKPYLWSKVTTPDGTVSYIRLTGEKGASITKSGEVNTYKVSDSGTTTPTGTWYSTKAAANNAYAWSANRYMWTKTVITWSDTSTTTLYSAERNPDDGDAGMSIVIASQSVTYSKQTSGNLDPTTLTYGSYPSSLSKGDWLYSNTTVNYQNSQGQSAGSTNSYAVSYIGTDGSAGAAGRGITGVYEHYKASANATGETTPTSSSSEWGTNPSPSDWGASKPYLWNYERITYSKGTTTERTTASVIAVWTENGKGVDSITNFYKKSNQSSGVGYPANDPDGGGTAHSGGTETGWNAAVQAPDETNQYLWNYERVKWIEPNGTYSYTYTDPHVIGHFGKDGKGMTLDTTNSSISYAFSSYGVAGSGRSYPSDITSWSSSVPTAQQGKYLWTKDVTAYKYSDGTSAGSTTTYGVSYYATDGDSVEIDTSRTNVRYSTQKTSSQPADSTFTRTTPPTLAQGDYLWCRSQTAYVGVTDALKSYSVSRVGVDGDEGDPGADGYTTHFAYATSSDGSQNFSTTNFSGATYIGTYRDQNAADSTTYTDYVWTQWKGDSITRSGNDTYRYATNNTGTRPAASSSSWNPTKPTLNKGYWLYTETTVHWSDGSTTVFYTDERNPNDGQAGMDIVAGTTTIQYKLTETNVQPTSGWGNYPSTLTQGWYLWSKATTPYYKGQVGGTSAGESVTYNVSYIAEDGAAGRSVTSVTEYYKASANSSGETAPSDDSGWSTNPNTAMQSWNQTNKYLWNYEKVTYSSGTTVERSTPAVIAIWTKDGAAGKGIDSITNYYKCTNSTTAPKRAHEGGTGWQTSPVAPDSTNQYLWNYEAITWVNPSSTTYTGVQMIGHYGKDGISSLAVDLDNDSDQFGTDSTGLTLSAQDKATGVKLYYGTTPQSITKLVATVYRASAPSTSVGSATATTSGTEVSGNVTISSTKVATIKSLFSGTSGTITFGIVNNVTINDDFIIKVEAFRSSSESRTANFTLKQVKSGAAGVAPDLCNLRPTLAKVSFTKSELSGSTAKTLGCGYTLVTPSGTTNTTTASSVSVNGTTYYIWWRYVGGTYAKFTTSSTIYSTGILPSTTQTGVEFVLSSASAANNIAASNTLDYENVPIIKDGTDGKGITSANVWYALNQSSTSAPSDFTLDDFPSTLNSGYYVWEATKVTYTNGSSEFTGKMCLGATTEFLTGTEVYAASASNSTTPTSWSTTYTKTKGYYLWAATRVQYTNGTYAYLNPKCVGYWGEDGTSPIIVDLTNENDAMVYDEFGVLKSGNVTSEAKLYVGSQDKSADATWTITPTNCTLSSGNSRNIVVTGMTALTATVTAVATYPSGSSNTYTAILSLKKLINEDKYELEVTPNAIAYNSTTNLPPAQDVSVNIWKTSHTDGSRTKSVPPSGYNVRVYANGQDTSYYYAGNKSDWATNPYVFTITPYSWSSCIVALNNASNLSSGSILDSESIPINKTENGDDGDSWRIAWYYKSTESNEIHSIASNDDYSCSLASTEEVGFKLQHIVNGVWTDSTDYYVAVRGFNASGTIVLGWNSTGKGRGTTLSSSGWINPASCRYYVGYLCKAAETSGTTSAVTASNIFMSSRIDKVTNGSSPYIADLDNEMDSVACDKNGKVKTSTTCGTNVSLFYGSSKRSYKITGITKNGTSTMGTGVTVKVDDSTPSYPTSASQTHTVSVTYATTATISSKDDFAITIQDATDTSITRVLHFTINGVREGANGEPAIIFRLNPNVSEIVKKKNDTYIPAGTSKVTCAVLKTTGSETSEEPINEIDDYVAKYKLNGTGSEIAFPIGGITVNTITSKLEIFLYNADSSILLDKETIPLVEDGTDGTSPYFADLDNEMDSIACTSAGATSSSYDKTINVNLWHGSTPISLTSLSYKVNGGSSYEDERTIGNVKITPSKTNKTVRIQVSSGVLVSRSDITITIAGTGSGNHDLHFILNPIKAGNNGTPATIFSLLPSTSSIKKDKSNTLVPASPMTCDVLKVTGNSTPTRATSSDGTLYYKVDGDITSTSTTGISQLVINTGQAAYTSSNKYITFAFFKGTTLLDKERVPIVYDGENAGQMQTNIIRESHFNTLSYWSTHVGEVVNNAIGDHKGFKITQSSTASYNSALIQYMWDNSRQWLSPSTIYTLSFWLKSDASTSSVYTYFYDYAVDPNYLPYVDGVRRTSASSNYTEYGRQDWESTNGSWVYHTFTFKTNSTRSTYTWRLLFGIWGTGTATATICMPKLELGDKASGYMVSEEEMGESYRILYTWNNTTKIEVKDLPCNADYSGSFSGNFYFYLQRLVDGSWTDCPNYYWAIRGFNSSGGINYGYNGSTTAASNNISSTTVNSSNNRYFEVYFLTEAMTPAGNSTAAVTETTTRKIFMSSRISKVPAGDGGLSIVTRPSTMVVNTDENGNTEAASQDFIFDVFKGDDEVTPSQTSHGSLPTGFTWTGRNQDAFTLSCPANTTLNAPAVVTFTVTISGGGSISDSIVLVPNKRGAKGADAIHLDLNNEMDSIQYAGNSTKVGSNVTTTATLYKGKEPIESGVTYSIISYVGCSSSTATIDSSTGVATVSGIGVNYNKASITIQAAYGIDNYTAVFVVNKIIDKPKYELEFDKNVISVNKSVSSASQENINVYVYKTTINSNGVSTRTLVSSLSSENLKLFHNDHGIIEVDSYNSGFQFSVLYTPNKSLTFYLTTSSASTSTVTSYILDMETIPVVVVENGQQGIQGKMGRTPYYWGEWSDKESTDAFTVNDYMTPYVANGETGGIPKCWIFVGANGSYTKSTAGEPSNTNQKWQLMTSDFEYLITKAIFSDFAKLGSGIFNGDFMFSQYGTYDGNTNSNEYNRFTPEVFNEPVVVTSSNRTIQTSEVQLKTNIRLVNGAFYRVNVTFESVSANSTFYLRFYRSGVSTAAINWSGSITTTTKTFSRATVNTDGSGYWGVTADNYIAKAVVSTGNAVISSVVIEHIDFNPNLSIDWLNGIIRANTGWFKNVTVEGVMNNLIQEITSENYTDYGVYTSGTNTDAFWLNTAKVGSIIRYKYTKPLGLPSAYANAGTPVETYLCDSGDGTHQMTLNELRQCIGKKIYVLTDENTGMARIRVGKWFSALDQEKMLLYNNTWYYDFNSNTTIANWFWVFECKMGERNGRECIYWELLASHNKLPDNLAF